MKSLLKKLKRWFICGSKIHDKYQSTYPIYYSNNSVFAIENNYMENLKFGDEFNSLKFRAKNVYGAKDLNYSNRADKKYVVTLKNGDKIHFGDRRYADYSIHKNPEKRMQYRKRASKIKNRYGKLTYKDPKYANYWSYHLLW